MPYTKEERRKLQYEPLRLLSQFIENNGDLNHAICELTAMQMVKTGGMGYTNVSNWIDAVDGAEKELTRRLLDPYEDKVMMENGDVRSFVTLIRQIRPSHNGHRKDEK